MRTSLAPSFQLLSRRTLAAASAAVVAATAANPASAQDLERRYLYANSYCKHAIRLLVHHKDSQRPHHTHAWYSLAPYEETRLADNGITLMQIAGEPVYVFAETTGPNAPAMQWAGSDNLTNHNGVNYRLRQVALTLNQRGELEFSLTCG